MRHARWFFPGWICRFYIADDVPPGIVSRLKDCGAEVINMGQNIGYVATFWRFLATVDPDVDISIVRDTDSRFSKYELKMVNEWLASGKKFHAMYPIYSRHPIQAGMWGVRGPILEFREPLEDRLRSTDFSNANRRGLDQDFLLHNLYPLTKGDVYVHEASRHLNNSYYRGELPTKRDLQGPIAFLDDPVKQRRFYVGEQIQPFNYFWGDIWYIRTGRPRRIFIALSIYKNIPFYEYFLAQFIGVVENRNLFRLINRRTSKIYRLNVKFYVADDIRPDLIERLRRLGQVILKPAKTVHRDDPQYWKLSILAEKNLGLAMMIGFWEFFLLARVARWGLVCITISHSFKATGGNLKSQFRKLQLWSICGPGVPVAQIDELVAQRNPKESYHEFVRSTLSYQEGTVATTTLLQAMPLDVIRGLKGWIILLFPPIIYDAVSRTKEFLKNLF